MSADVLLDIDPLVIEELDTPIPCEGESHAAGKVGHVPAEPAAWLQTFPGHPCGRSFFKCEGYRTRFRAKGISVTCGKCRSIIPNDKVVFLPINEDVS